MGVVADGSSMALCYDGTMEQVTRPSFARHFVGVALLGAASGMRSTAGLASVVRARRKARAAGVLGRPLAGPAALVAVGAELVVDKLPSTGSRLEPAGLAGRIGFAALAAGIVARHAGRALVPSVVVAVGATVAAAKIAHDVRAQLDESVADRTVGAAEDALSLTTGWLGARLTGAGSGHVAFA